MPAHAPFRDQMIELCHFVRSPSWEGMLGQACRLAMAATGAGRAWLFLNDVTGAALELAAAQAPGDSHWAPQALRLAVDAGAGSACPLAQAAQTGRTLVFTGSPAGYDFSRLTPVMALPAAGQHFLVIPLRSEAWGFLGVLLLAADGAMADPGHDTALRLVLGTLTDAIASRRDELRREERARQTAAELERVRREREARRTQAAQAGASRLIGASKAIAAVRGRLPELARSRGHVLILGEQGTGKELVARELHDLSPWRGGRFVYHDCARTPGAAFESTLFGYRRGAVPGEAAARRGLLREAAGGTIYLDNIFQVSPEAQATLARVLETRAFRPLGSERDCALEARLIVSAPPDFLRQVEGGAFLSSLSLRLSEALIRMPSLAERKEDIAVLAEAALASREGREPLVLSPAALGVLHARHFPGNLRELSALVCRAAEFPGEDENELQPHHLDAALGVPGTDDRRGAETGNGLREVVARVEAEMIRLVLDRNDGDRATAARILDIPKRTLADKCKKYAL